MNRNFHKIKSIASAEKSLSSSQTVCLYNPHSFVPEGGIRVLLLLATATIPVFVAQVVNDGISFVETNAIFLHQYRYLPKCIVLFGFFGLGHCRNVSIGNSKFFEHPDTSESTRLTNSNKLWTGLNNRHSMMIVGKNKIEGLQRQQLRL